MARIRTTKPDFWTSEQVVECSRDARLFFIGLWNFCDDSGIHPRTARRLKMLIFPADDISAAEVEGWIDELIDAGLLASYEVEGKTYLKVTGWHHQRIDRPSYKYPLPGGHIPTTHKTSEKNRDSATPRRLFDESSVTEEEEEEEREEEGEEEVDGRLTSDERASVEVDQRLISQESFAERTLAGELTKKLGQLPRSKSDRSLALKASWLALNRFNEHWLWDSVEGVLRRKGGPPQNRWSFLHKCLENKCQERFKANFKRELALIQIANELLSMPPPPRDQRSMPRSRPEDDD